MSRNRDLLAWYRREGRHLPWRGLDDPWAILVSEVMAQQTQVGRVADRFGPFMARYPTPGALADAAPEQTVADWGGLGYLRRLHFLRAAARTITDQGWPEDLTTLPGVGPYTAAALRCFAFGEPVAAVDTNHRRVLSRWVGRALAGTELWDEANALIDRDDPSGWNQAVMDLGATVCRPTPRCDRCPVSSWCADPTVYEPPAPQTRYDGSLRQARAAILKLLADRPGISTDEAAASIGLPTDRVSRAADALEKDGMITIESDVLRLS